MDNPEFVINCDTGILHRCVSTTLVKTCLGKLRRYETACGRDSVISPLYAVHAEHGRKRCKRCFPANSL